MKYAHEFHAGNFADTHKHVALVALLQDLQQKPGGIQYLDTHASSGSYGLSATRLAGAQPGDAGGGLVAVRGAKAADLPDELQHYLKLQHGHRYQGSAALVCQQLRPQDRALLFELVPETYRKLRQLAAEFPGARAECGDGLQALRAWLPARQRRALILIDPPYEDITSERAAIEQGLRSILERQPTAVTALWYPIKRAADTERWLHSRLRPLLTRPTLRLELCPYPTDSRAGLNGSGLLIINPTFHLQQRAHLWQGTLAHLLAAESAVAAGGSRIQWLVDESASVHAATRNK